MHETTWQAIDAHFARFPAARAKPLSDSKIDALSQSLRTPFDPDYRAFLSRYGAGVVGAYAIIGFGRAKDLMDPSESSVVAVTRRYRAEHWPGVSEWIVVSEDHAGNPVGIASDGSVWLSDHDFGGPTRVAPSFEAFLRTWCLKLPADSP